MVPEVVELDHTGVDLDAVVAEEECEEEAGCLEHTTAADVGQISEEEAVSGCHGQVRTILGSAPVEHWALIWTVAGY